MKSKTIYNLMKYEALQSGSLRMREFSLNFISYK